LEEALFTLLFVCFFGSRAELWPPFYRALSHLTPSASGALGLSAATFPDPARTALAGLAELDRQIAGLRGEQNPTELLWIARAAFWVDRVSECRPALWRIVESGRTGGAVASALSALAHLGYEAFSTGRWDEAIDLAYASRPDRADSSNRRCRSSGQPRRERQMARQATPRMAHHDSTAPKRNLVLAAMVVAVAMTFIDQTIVAIAIPNVLRELSLSATGSQWVINGYLLSLAALFVLGGRLSDVLGRRRMVVIGVIGFALASACCGFTPKGSLAGAWIISFRVVQGAMAALMFPAAVGIVVASFPLRERGRAMAIFFGISGGLTAIGPIAGGFLTQWTWRSIFWINVPVAILALVLIRKSRPVDEPRPARLDYRGAVLITGAMGLIVLGLQQSTVWGWNDTKTRACLLSGALLMVAFVGLRCRPVAGDERHRPSNRALLLSPKRRRPDRGLRDARDGR
jgi:hypothetical protein